MERTVKRKCSGGNFRLIILCGLLLCACNPSETAANGRFAVAAVLDGDTIRIAKGGATIPIRLIGIDAPETSKGDGEPGQPYCVVAKRHLANLVRRESVEVVSYGKDDYGRILGVVYLRDTNLNLEMVRAGLAEAYRGRPTPGFDYAPYWEAEKEARRARRGMWAQGPRYVSPYEWRKKLR